ncbi:MAG: hypothetical protein QNJ46_05885 [Leptolyngbyaceae cyanobacterium MO_188.B28]|nr:hypothetical protein [Leptolyngbyaceae cyanobacterium MO_188.B28]
MPNRINTSTDNWKLNQGDIFGDGKDDASSGNAGAIVYASSAEGQKLPTAAIDGDLQTIDTAAEAIATDPTANTTGDASTGYSQSFLWRWLIKLSQIITGRLPELVSGRIPVDGSGVTQPVSGAVTVSGSITANLGTLNGAATESTLAALSGKINECDSTDANTSAANTAATFTISAPGVGNFIRLKALYFGYDAPPTAGTLTISATGLTSIVIPVTSEGAGFLPMALKAPDNTAVTVTLSAGGAGVVGYVGAIYGA